MSLLAWGYHSVGRDVEAVDFFEEVLSGEVLDQDASIPSPPGGHRKDIMHALARILATSPVDELRDGVRAVQLASRACKLTHYHHPIFVNTLAAAYAEKGDFDSAVKYSEKAIALLAESENTQLRDAFIKALENYKSKKTTQNSECVRREIFHYITQL